MAGSGLAFDILLAVLMTLVTLAASVAESHPSKQFIPAGHRIPAAPAAAYVLVAASGLALVWRRRRPDAVLAASLAAVVVYTCLGYVNGAAILNPMLALYAAAVALPTRRALELSILTMVALMAASAAFDPLGATSGGFALIPFEGAAALFLGLWVGSRRAYTRRENEEQARRAVDAERLRIARELHDVVAHTMATINVQAGVAAHVIDQQPDEARQALGRDQGGQRRGPARAAGDPQRPAPGRRGRLPGTGPASRAAGGADRGDHPRGPAHDPDRGWTAGGARADRRSRGLSDRAGVADQRAALRRPRERPRDLVLRTRCAGRRDRRLGARAAAPPQGGGHGIPGMRERAEAAGGSLEAGPRPDGGFRVRARLPLERRS